LPLEKVIVSWLLLISENIITPADSIRAAIKSNTLFWL